MIPGTSRRRNPEEVRSVALVLVTHIYRIFILSRCPRGYGNVFDCPHIDQPGLKKQLERWCNRGGRRRGRLRYGFNYRGCGMALHPPSACSLSAIGYGWPKGGDGAACDSGLSVDHRNAETLRQ